jgi:hypothetical protein
MNNGNMGNVNDPYHLLQYKYRVGASNFSRTELFSEPFFTCDLSGLKKITREPVLVLLWGWGSTFLTKSQAAGLDFVEKKILRTLDGQNFGHLVQPVTRDLRDHRYPSVLPQ